MNSESFIQSRADAIRKIVGTVVRYLPGEHYGACVSDQLWEISPDPSLIYAEIEKVLGVDLNQEVRAKYSPLVSMPGDPPPNVWIELPLHSAVRTLLKDDIPVFVAGKDKRFESGIRVVTFEVGASKDPRSIYNKIEIQLKSSQN